MNNKGTDAMCAQNNKRTALVPRLRFPEFRMAGEWTTKPLSKIARITQGGTPSTGVPEYWNGEIQWITPAEMGKDVNPYVSRTARTLTQKGLRNCSSELLPEGSIILSTRAPIGHLAINTRPMAINQGCRGIVADTDFEFKFIYYYLGHNRSRLEDIGAGNTFKELSGSALKEFLVSVPKNGEQKKIADCLFSLDELLSAESQKLDTLKIHKKGLMQQLFPREGETVPRLRFPEFRRAGAWARVTAGELFSNRTERGNSRLPIYSVTTTDGLVPRASLDRRIEDVAESGSNKTVRKGDIAYNMMRMWQGSLGVAPEDCMVSPAYIVLEPQAGVNAVFFYFMLKLPETLQVLTAHSRGLTEDRLRLYYDDFAKIPLRCPSSSEQERIADILSSVDGLITAQSSTIDALKTHKKGLMQQLFPVSAEVQA